MSIRKEEGLFQQMTIDEVGGLLTKYGKLLDSIVMYKLVDLPELLELFNVKNPIVVPPQEGD